MILELKKIVDENLDGIVLAASGLLRAGLEDKISYYIPKDIMIPAPAQGALAIEIRENSKDIEEIINSLQDMETEIQVAAERGFLDGINGSCHIPIGAYCDVDGENVSLTGLYGDEEGNNLIIKTISGKASEAREIGLQLAKLISKEYEDYEG